MQGHTAISVQIPDALYRRLIAEHGLRLSADGNTKAKMREVVAEALERHLTTCETFRSGAAKTKERRRT